MRSLTGQRAWLVVVLLAVLANVMGYVTHDHFPAKAGNDHAEVCGWCVAHAGIAPPLQLPNFHALAPPAVPRILGEDSTAVYSSPVLTAQPRGPPPCAELLKRR